MADEKKFDGFQGNVIRIGGECFEYVGDQEGSADSDPAEIQATFSSCPECQNASSSLSAILSSESSTEGPSAGSSTELLQSSSIATPGGGSAGSTPGGSGGQESSAGPYASYAPCISSIYSSSSMAPLDCDCPIPISAYTSFENDVVPTLSGGEGNNCYWDMVGWTTNGIDIIQLQTMGSDVWNWFIERNGGGSGTVISTCQYGDGTGADCPVGIAAGQAFEIEISLSFNQLDGVVSGNRMWWEFGFSSVKDHNTSDNKSSIAFYSNSETNNLSVNGAINQNFFTDIGDDVSVPVASTLRVRITRDGSDNVTLEYDIGSGYTDSGLTGTDAGQCWPFMTCFTNNGSSTDIVMDADWSGFSISLT